MFSKFHSLLFFFCIDCKQKQSCILLIYVKFVNKKYIAVFFKCGVCLLNLPISTQLINQPNFLRINRNPKKTRNCKKFLVCIFDGFKIIYQNQYSRLISLKSVFVVSVVNLVWLPISTLHR